MSSAQAIPSPAGRDASLHRAARLGARAAELVLVLVIAWLAAQALWFTLYGADTRKLDLPASGAAPGVTGASASGGVDRPGASDFEGLFATRGAAVEAADGPAPESRLNYQLRGVRVEPGGASVAIIEIPGQGQKLLRVGDELSDGITLADVTNAYVTINRRGARESVYLREDARRGVSTASAPSAASPSDRAVQPPLTAGAQPGGLTGAPDPAVAASLTSDDYVDGLRLEPVLEGGSLRGLRVRGNTQLDVLRATGLLPDDVIRSVNGTRIDGADAARAVAGTFETAGQARLEIERAGAPVTLTIPLQSGG